jgi:hypothetical protein
MAHWLYLPDDAVEDLMILANLKVEQAESLREHFDANDFVPRSSYYTKVADLVNISDDAASGLCSFVNSVRTQRSRQNRDAASVPDELIGFLQRIPKDKGSGETIRQLTDYVAEQRDFLVSLFSEPPGRDHSDKVRDLESGPLPHVHSIRTFCDIRPVYDAEATEIVAYLPMITLSMVIHKTWSDEFEEVAVLLSDSDIDDLRETLERLDKKLAILKKRHQLTDPKTGEC